MATRDKTETSDLLRLAQDCSVRGKTVLLENISEFFLTDEDRLSDRERALMHDILRKLIRDVETPIRRELARQLSQAQLAPHDLIVRLANDEIEVARPILMESGVLEDADLIEIVRNRTREHRLVVALRSGLAEIVSDALIASGEEDVVVALLRNPDARLSRRATEYLVAESQRQDQFREPLIQRRDLPGDLALRMYWWVSAALRRHILANFEIDEVELSAFVEESTLAAFDRMDREPPSAEKQAEALVARLDERGELTASTLIQVLRSGRFLVFAAGLARMCQVSLCLAQRLILDWGVETLAVACRAIDMDRQNFALVFMLTRKAVDRRSVREPMEITDALRLYDGLKRDRAERVLRYWQLSAGFSSAIDAVES